MNISVRNGILRANAVFLCGAAAGGFFSDLMGIFAGKGPVAPLVAAAPHSGIGLVEAHGLAFILGVLLWRAVSPGGFSTAVPARSWHWTAVAIHSLLGTANLVFWQTFIAGDMLAVGYVTTILHGTFAALQLGAALAAPGRNLAEEA